MACKRCGKNFRVEFNQAQRGGGKYCSRQCRYGLTPEERFWAKVEKTDSCWLWRASTTDGYGRMTINRRLRLAHRVSWEIANGAIPDGLLVLHDCPGGDNPLCVNPAHLYLGVNADNSRDAVLKHQMSHGECHKGAKLTEQDVREIRRRKQNGESHRMLAKEFGVSSGRISDIGNRRSWRHVD